MTIHALTGLLALNLLYLACGAASLWLLRGWSTWSELARLAGVAYLAGVVVLGGLWTILVIAGIPFSGWLMLVSAIAVVAGAIGGGRRLGRGRPSAGALADTRGLVVAAVGIALVGVVLEALFRRARLAGLYDWDAWAFWVPKGKIIYLLDGIDNDLFTSFPGPSYPPLVPVLDAAAFHAMGEVDVNTLHVQFWFFGVGLVWGLAGLLAGRVPSWIAWPFLVLAVVAPRLGQRFDVPEADLLLDAFFVLATVLLLFWLLHGQRWMLVLATLFMGGMVLTKREGILLVAIVLVTAIVVSFHRRRKTWPALGLAAVVVVAIGAPWRMWYWSKGIEGEFDGGGPVAREGVDRLTPSLRLAFDVLLDSGYWSVLVQVAIGALALAALVRAWTLVAFLGIVLLLVTLGGGWITYSIPELEITQEPGANPILRYMGAAGLLCVVAAPLLLGAVWEKVQTRPESG